MDICALYYIWNLFGVMVLQPNYASLEAGRANLPWVYVYCAIYELVWCNGFPDTYDWLEGRDWHQSAIGICALCYIYLSVDLPIWYIGMQGISAQVRGSICHRSMLHHHTSPCQLIIHPCYTFTPPCQLTIDPATLLHPISLTYITMHIYPWQMHPQPPINYTAMLHCYTP